MVREHTVAVKAKGGSGDVTFCAGARHDVSVKAGETATTWGDGSPILRTEFEALLEPTGHFEIAGAAIAKKDEAGEADSEKI